MDRPPLEVRVRDAAGRPRAFRLVPWRLAGLMLILLALPLAVGIAALRRLPAEVDEAGAERLLGLEVERLALLEAMAILEQELARSRDEGDPDPLIPLPELDTEPSISVAVGRVLRAVAIDGVGLALNGKPTGGPVDVWWMQGGLGLAGDKALPDDLVFTATGDVVVGRVGTFPGAVRLAWDPVEILVINELPMERYLEAVVSSEVPDSWSLEAKKAQAVAARSYGLARRHRRDGPFAVESSTLDQVYRQGALDPGAVEAVRATRGKILSRGDALVEAYYHSTCAGHTEAAAVVWPERGAIDDWSVPCPYCANSPSIDWRHTLALADMGSMLELEHPDMGAVSSLQLLGRTGSDRVRGVSLRGPGGTLILTGNEFRRLFGYTKVRSTWFDVEQVDGGLQLTGRGSGHGVGMCQWGAQGMARQGKTHDEILAFYYDGAGLHAAYE